MDHPPKKRLYSEEYLKYGFTCITISGDQRPQCVVCAKTLSADSMKPSLLKRHLAGCHSELKDKDVEFFRRKERGIKRERLDASGAFQTQTQAAVKASYEVSYRIAQQKKPHTIGENLVLPCAVDIVRIMLGEESAKKILPLSLSNNTVQRRIADMSDDIKAQVIDEIKSAPLGLFALQLDESTDVASCAQLMVFIRYIYSRNFKEEFLFCEPLQAHTRGIDVFMKLKTFFEREGLHWSNVCGVCTDGAPSMLGIHSGFQSLVKKEVPNACSIHCMLHRQALASKTLPASLSAVMSEIVKSVNYIKSSAINTRLFSNLCRDLDSQAENLLYHTEVRWLSRGNVVKRVFLLRNEIFEFLTSKKQNKLAALFQDKKWLSMSAYLVDIFAKLNALNMSLQGTESTVLDYTDKMQAFFMKLDLWISKVAEMDFVMFETLSEWLAENDTMLDVDIQQSIAEHMTVLKRELSTYFSDIKDKNFELVRNPFTASIGSISDSMVDVQEQFIELINDSSAKEVFKQVTIVKFWCQMVESYPKVAEIAIRILLPFPTTYMCELSFSHLLSLKTKQRNRLTAENDLRCALSKTKPRIDRIIAVKQCQTSH